jgi:C4-dicarboxylate-specific signal transduction histidine kinase
MSARLKKAPLKKAKSAKGGAEEQQALTIYAAKMATLAEMAGGIAHEINTPLAIILTLASQMREMAEEGDINNSVFISSMKTIESTTGKIADIISGLRTFAREGSQEVSVEHLKEVPIRTLIDDTMALCRERFINRGVSLEFMLPSAPVTAECNPGQMSQVIMNILLNSLDALMKVANRWIHIEVQDRGKTVEISIADSGSGIPKAHHDKIFSPFFTTKEIGQGPGLGLSVSRSIVQNHGGTLTLDAKADYTRFVITLPKKAKHRAA